MKETKTLEQSIACYLSNEIVMKHMPSLDVCGMTGKKVTTTWGEYKEYERLHDLWHSKYDNEVKDSAKDEWNAQMKYSYMLKEKYLPHNIKFYVPYIDVSNEETKKKILEALISALWHSDVCEYSLDEGDVDIINEDEDKFFGGFTYVTMKLCLKAPNSYTGEDWIEIKTKQK